MLSKPCGGVAGPRGVCSVHPLGCSTLNLEFLANSDRQDLVHAAARIAGVSSPEKRNVSVALST
jgi:hypothetical protein